MTSNWEGDLTTLTGKVLVGLTRHSVPSANPVFRGDVLLSDGTIRRAFIKDLDARQLGNELLVASLADLLGIPVPVGVLAVVEESVSSGFNKLRSRDGNGHVVFCSMDAEVSTVAQIISAGHSIFHILKYLKRSPLMGQLYGFDTWIANIDRHRNNLILRGDGQIFLIDHGHCFSGPAWSPSSLNAAGQYVNRLKHWLTPTLTNEEKDGAMADMRALTAKMLASDIQAIVDDLFLSSLYGANDCDALVGFLESRVSHVMALGANSLETL